MLFFRAVHWQHYGLILFFTFWNCVLSNYFVFISRLYPVDKSRMDTATSMDENPDELEPLKQKEE